MKNNHQLQIQEFIKLNLSKIDATADVMTDDRFLIYSFRGFKAGLSLELAVCHRTQLSMIQLIFAGNFPP